MCWAFAAIVGVGGIAFDGSYIWMRHALLSCAACLALVLPNYRGAKASGSRHAFGQAAIWAAGAVFLVLALSKRYELTTALALPGELNINTTETIRRRQQLSEWGLLDIDLVMVATVPLSIMTTALLTGLLACRSTSPLNRALSFGVFATLGVMLAAVGGAIAAPILGHLVSMGSQGGLEIVAAVSGFLAGAAVAGGIAGAFTEFGRERCFAG